jgi:predicted  nucleic acid-binding Zn-ribbon protein
MPKQVKIHLSRAITLNRKGKESLPLHAGLNTVDAEVAEHGFVKAHMVEDAIDATVAGDPELQAKYDELLSQVDALGKDALKDEKAIAKANAKIEALEAQLSSTKDGKAIAAANARIAELEAAIVEKDSVIAAYEAAGQQ